MEGAIQSSHILCLPASADMLIRANQIHAPLRREASAGGNPAVRIFNHHINSCGPGCVAHPKHAQRQAPRPPLGDEIQLHPIRRWQGGGPKQAERLSTVVQQKMRGAFVFREFSCRPLVEAVRRHADDVEIIWVERLWVAHHLRDLGRKIIVDLDDIESVRIARVLADREFSVATLAAWHDWWKTRRTERKALDVFQRVAVCSELDTRFWPRHRDRVWVVPNGFNDELLTLLEPQNDAPRVIFVGALAYSPNVEGVLMFAKKAMPLLLERFPALEFWIVGRGPIEEVLALDNGGNIRVFGDVPDVVEYVRQCSVSIVPVRIGGGTRLKILESLAAGVPVITTTVGVEGIELSPEQHYLLADNPDEFVAQTVRLLENPALGQRQVREGREAIARKYSWRAIREALADQLRQFRLGSAGGTGTIETPQSPGASP